MFHLFNSLYVEVDQEVDETVVRAVVSEQMGLPFLKVEDNSDAVEPLLIGSDLDQVGQLDFEAFLNSAVGLDKAFLYVDESAYIRIWAALVFTYLPEVDYETFRYLFLCKKGILNCRTTTSMRERSNNINPVVIVEPKVRKAFDFVKTDWLLGVFDKYVSNPEIVRSIEWDILGVRLGNPMGTIPSRLRSMIDRVLMTNVPDIMGYLSTFMGDPAKWSLVGADLDTLLGEETVFQGCYNLNYLSNAEFVMLSNINDRYPIDWLVEMIEELLMILRYNNDLSVVGYLENILDVYKKGFVIEDSSALMSLLHRFFDHGLKMVRISQRDIGKHDDNLLRFAINTPLETLSRITKGSKWII